MLIPQEIEILLEYGEKIKILLEYGAELTDKIENRSILEVAAGEHIHECIKAVL